jgi:DUF4097 and DUF4098 domain-containing protein YvlB
MSAGGPSGASWPGQGPVPGGVPPNPWGPRGPRSPFGYRGSLSGPLILILIGCAFLVTNLWPELPVWQLAADYWPFCLIAWGGLRVLEILYIYQQGKALPYYGMSGGEWVFALIAISVGSAVFAGHRVGERFQNGNFPSRVLRVFGEGYDFPVDQSVPGVGLAPRLVIEGLSGNIRANAGAADSIQVRGRSIVRAFSDTDARRFHEASPIELVREGDQVILRIRRGTGVPEQAGISADLDVTLPAGASIEARGRTGDLDVTGITGNVTLNADNAGVRLTNIGGNVQIETRRSDLIRLRGVKGTVELRGGGEDIDLEDIAGEVTIGGFYRGDLNLRNLAKPIRIDNRGNILRLDELKSGSIRADRGDFAVDGIKSPLMLHVGSADVKVSNASGPLDIEVARGDLDISPGAALTGAWTLRTGAGDVELALPPGFQLRARTGRGDIESDYNELRSVSSGRNAEVDGAVGKGPLVDANTGRGNISIRRAGTGTGSNGKRDLVRTEE